MVRQVVADILLALAVLTVAASALGVAVMRSPYARLHYVTPAAVVAPVLVALAVFVTEGLDENTGETVLALVIMVAAAPYLSHATIRAMRVREHGDWRAGRKDAEDSGGSRPSRTEPSRTEEAPR
ncbi:MAG TPA: monovalent cation/H(+) antiporter subunit G [Trebonia sp.]|nr:monovalent cation/H(+) antiporter subunit G [Trebonia sp.]